MIYLDNGATSFPKPKSVIDEIIKCMKEYCANPGRGSHKMALMGDDKIMECRQELAGLFNIDNIFNICFTKNATEGLNYGIMNLLKDGDHVITTTAEHNSVLRPIEFMSKNGVEVTYLKTGNDGYIDLNELKSAIKSNTRAIVINHASNVLGTVQDIAKIGGITREKDIVFMVDASQSAGIIDIDVVRDGIDIMAMPGHKALYGPQGIGVLYIREGLIIENKSILGGTGSNSNSTEQPDFMPDKFESGTVNLPAIAGLCEGVKVIKKIGIEKIRKQESKIIQHLYNELKKIKAVTIYGDFKKEKRCAVLSFNVEGYDSSDIGAYLSKNNICVRTGYHCAPLIHSEIDTAFKGTVRVSIGHYNTIQDCEILVRFIKKLLIEGL